MRVAEEESQLDRIERKLDELLHILGAGNSKTDAELSRRAKKLKKPCPRCDGEKKCIDTEGNEYDCELCHGSGHLPVEPGDVVVRVK